MTAYTKHAAARAQQRALPPMVDFLLDEFGQRSHDGRGAVRVYFTHESVRRMERAFGRRPVAKMSEYLDAYRVDDSRDGTTITIGHRSQRMRRAYTMSENSQSIVTDQSVSICFGELMSAMRASADGLRMRALEALLDREDDKAQACLPAIASIKEAEAEIEAAYRKWNGARAVLVSPRAASKPNSPLPPSKRPGSKLRVWLNGQEIDGSNAAETFARAIEAIGIGRVASLGMTLSGIALVGETEATGYQSQSFVSGIYLCTHSNNSAKKQILDSIADRLRLSLRVTIEER